LSAFDLTQAEIEIKIIWHTERQESVSQLCKRTHPKSLSWKERDFPPPSLQKKAGKWDELFNFYITTQPRHSKCDIKHSRNFEEFSVGFRQVQTDIKI
jgi:hypothetical protein